MRTAAGPLLFAAIGIAASSTLANAQGVGHARHHHHRVTAVGHGYGAPSSYGPTPDETRDPYDAPGPGGYGPGAGEIIRRATERAQREPGVTRELAPDSRQTATGGPVGGIPGFDGM